MIDKTESRAIDSLKARLSDALAAYPGAFLAPRDFSLEKEILDLHKVELYLLSTLGTARMKSWLRSGKQRGGFYEIGQYRIITRSHSSRTPDLGQRLREIADQVRRSADILKSLSRQDWGEEKGDAQQALAQFAVLLRNQCTFLGNEARGIQQPTEYRIGTIHDMLTGRPLLATSWGAELVGFHCGLENLPLAAGVQQLGGDLAIDLNGSMDLPQIASRSGWRMVSHKEPVLPGHPSQLAAEIGKFVDHTAEDKYGRASYHVRVYSLADGRRVVLPWTVWNKHGEDALHPLYVPPERMPPIIWRPRQIVNEDLTEAQAANNTLSVIFDAPEVAAVISSVGAALWRERILAWYGAEEVAERIEWPLPKGGRVCYVVCNHSGIPRDRALDTARRVCARLAELGVDTSTIDLFAEIHPATTTEGNSCHSWDWSTAASPYPVIATIPVPGASADRASGTGKEPFVRLRDVDTYDDVPYLVSPVIAKGTVSLMHARSGVGKTWLAMHIACSVASGTELFGRWIPNGEGGVLYIDGEMGDVLMAKRLKRVAAAFTESQRAAIDRLFLLRSVGSDLLDLATEEGQEEVERFLAEAKRRFGEKPSLLVLDNLGALSQYSDSTKSWRELFAWLRDLKKRGIATLLVHHTNKAGAQRGTDVKVASVDNSFKVSEVECTGLNTIALRIDVEKGRELDGGAKRPLVVEFVPSSRKPAWRVRRGFSGDGKAKERELKDLIRDRVSNGSSNAEIAEDLDMNINTFKALKRRLEVTRRYTKRKDSSRRAVVDDQDSRP